MERFHRCLSLRKCLPVVAVKAGVTNRMAHFHLCCKKNMFKRLCHRRTAFAVQIPQTETALLVHQVSPPPRQPTERRTTVTHRQPRQRMLGALHRLRARRTFAPVHHHDCVRSQLLLCCGQQVCRTLLPEAKFKTSRTDAARRGSGGSAQRGAVRPYNKSVCVPKLLYPKAALALLLCSCRL